MNRYPPDSRLRAPRAMPYQRDSYDTEQPPWDELDAGVRSLVRLLWLAGFQPTDSGDGKSKFANCDDCQAEVLSGICQAHEAECLTTPHVFMVLHDPAELFTEANRLHAFVAERLGVCPAPIGNVPKGWSPVHIEASYDPATGTSILSLLGLDDSMLPPYLVEQKR